MSKRADESYFDGTVLQWIGWGMLAYLVTVFTLGICFPWAICMLYRWETGHTVVNGRRLRFTGTAPQLFGSWIKWLLLTLITLGIYGLWVYIKTKQWLVEHTEFSDAIDTAEIEQEQPQLTPTPFPLKSSDLIYAPGMLEYCKFYHFECGATDDLCNQLFSVAEKAVGPDLEVVMAFIALKDYNSVMDNGGPCACVMSNTKFIVALKDTVTEIPATEIKGFSLKGGPPMGVITVNYKGPPMALRVESAKTDELLYVCNASLKACQEEIKAKESTPAATA